MIQSSACLPAVASSGGGFVRGARGGRGQGQDDEEGENAEQKLSHRAETTSYLINGRCVGDARASIASEPAERSERRSGERATL